MYRIKYIFLILVFIIQNSLAVSLNDIENVNKTKLMALEKEDIVQAIKDLPSSNMITLQSFLKETKIRFKLAVPLLLAGIAELYLTAKYTNAIDKMKQECSSECFISDIDSPLIICGYSCFNKDYEKKINNYEPHDNNILNFLSVYLLADIVLSSGYLVSKSLYQYIINPFLFVQDIYSNISLYCVLYFYSYFLEDDVYLAKFISAYALIIGFLNINNRLKDRCYDVFERIGEDQTNINKSLQQVPVCNYFDNSSNIYLYINNNNMKDYYCNTIEAFYKWIAIHKNDICLHKLINCAYTPNKIANYSTQKLADIAKGYQPGNTNNKTIHYKKYELELTLIEENIKLTPELLTKSLEKQGIKLIEVDSTDIENKPIYKYRALINDNKNYYLVFGIELNNEITKSSKTYAQVIYNSIFNNKVNYPETSTLVIKFDSIDKIQSIIKYIFLYIESNQHTCIYDVKLNSNLNQKDK